MNEQKKKRITQKNKRIKRREAMDIDITSLLDILVILLVFLLHSYNASNLELDLVDNITPPGSQARELGDDALIVQVNKNNEVWIGYEKLETKIVDGMASEELYRRVIDIARQNSPTLSKEEIIEKNRKNNKTVNLVFDKAIPYSTMQTIMKTVAKAGHSDFRFIVMADYAVAQN